MLLAVELDADLPDQFLLRLEEIYMMLLIYQKVVV